MSPTPVDSAVHPRTLLYAVHSNLVSTRRRLFSHLSINRFNRYLEEGSTNTGTDCLRKQMKQNAWYIILILIINDWVSGESRVIDHPQMQFQMPHVAYHDVPNEDLCWTRMYI